MPTEITRRSLLALSGAMLLLSMAGPRAAAAQALGAHQFVQDFANELVNIVNGPEPYAQKKAALGPVIDKYVGVNDVARFCLGRFWRTATPEQQAQYTTLFHHVLLNNISGHLGEFKGVSYRMTDDTQQGSNFLVGTIIDRPNAPAANVQWVVDASSGTPHVVDVIAEGTSMRLTTRDDYQSYLSSHNNDISALLEVLQRKLDSSG
jgi:phospholipid transport system substrate-binding protein